MPQYFHIAVIAVLSTVVSTQALAQGNSAQSNGVPHVIHEALANGINVEVTNSPAVTVENQVDVSVVGETEVVVTNASPIEVTVSNFPDTSGGGGDESGYLGLTSVAMDGDGGLTGKVRQCQADYGHGARLCGGEELSTSGDLTAFADDLDGLGSTYAWIQSKLISAHTNRSGYTVLYYQTVGVEPNNRLRWSLDGVCQRSEDIQRGSVLLVGGSGGTERCDKELYTACCR